MIPLPPIDAALIAYTIATCAAVKVDVQWTGISASLIPAEASLSLTGDPCRSRPELRLAVIEEGALSAHYTLNPSLTVWVEMPTVAFETKAGDPVTILKGIVDSSKVVGMPLSGDGLIAKMDLAPGTPVTSRVAQTRPDASSGDNVELIYAVGALTITAPGRLLADSTIGDEVKAINKATNQATRGTLTSSNTVTVVR